jgi:hypothetical protein
VASIRHLVTDERADPDVLAMLASLGVQVHVAGLELAHREPARADSVS